MTALSAGRASSITEADPDKLADTLDQEADTMERRSERMSEQLADIRKDWEQKRADPSVPGAPPPGSDEASGDD